MNAAQEAGQNREARKAASRQPFFPSCHHGGKTFELEMKPAYHEPSARAVFDTASLDVRATPIQRQATAPMAHLDQLRWRRCLYDLLLNVI